MYLLMSLSRIRKVKIVELSEVPLNICFFSLYETYVVLSQSTYYRKHQ